MENNEKELFSTLTKEINRLTGDKGVQSVEFRYDEENNVLDILVRPIQTTKYVTVNLTVTPTGMEFRDF